MSTGSVAAFSPVATYAIASVTTGSTSVTGPNESDAVLIYNSSASIVFVALGVGAATATQDSTPIPAGGELLLATGGPRFTAGQAQPSAGVNTVAAITITGGTGGTVYATFGRGTQR